MGADSIICVVRKRVYSHSSRSGTSAHARQEQRKVIIGRVVACRLIATTDNPNATAAYRLLRAIQNLEVTCLKSNLSAWQQTGSPQGHARLGRKGGVGKRQKTRKATEETTAVVLTVDLHRNKVGIHGISRIPCSLELDLDLATIITLYGMRNRFLRATFRRAHPTAQRMK